MELIISSALETIRSGATVDLPHRNFQFALIKKAFEGKSLLIIYHVKTPFLLLHQFVQYPSFFY